jgi:glutamate/tyrosine decarboxylase-like PLP-dependent enzyme
MNSKEILDQLFKVIQQYTLNIADDKHPVVDYKSPAELSKIIHFPIDEDGTDNETFGRLMQDYVAYSVHTGNKRFINQLFSGLNVPAFAGDVLSILTNTSMYTYEVAPMATLIEKEIIATMNGYVGYENGDGIFLTGGSNGNLIAMFSARNKKIPSTRYDGILTTRKLTAFVSEHAHYSFENAANILGIGAHNVIKVPVDDNGRMKPDQLDKAISASLEREEIPFFVGATCGTTVMAAFDPLEPIAEICKKYNLWFHADGAFGSSLILSPKNQDLFKGSELTDSFCWDAHKLMGIPLISSALLVKQKGILQSNLSDINTDYIYHDNSEIEDLGKKSVQCGRRVDAVKLWFSWKYYGRRGYEEKVDHLMNLAAHAEQHVHNHPKLQMVAPRQTLTVCFRYIPQNTENINEFNFNIRENLRKSGKNMVNVAWLNNMMFIRLISSNFESQISDVDTFFENFIETAANLEISLQAKPLTP